MSISREKLAEARADFVAEPSNNTCVLFLSKLREAEEEGNIDDDEFHNGLAEVEAYLWKGGSVVAGG